MKGPKEFEARLYQLVKAHPGKVVWTGGWAGKMTADWLDMDIDDPRAKSALNQIAIAEGFDIMMAILSDNHGRPTRRIIYER
jgi:hypothetical protein